MPLVSYIIPTLNEARNIDLLLSQIFEVSDRNDIDFEVVFSDGGSQDQTVKEIEGWLDTGKVKVIQNPARTGLSEAVIIASKSAEGEFVIVMDADLSHPISALPELLSHLCCGDYEMVIGSRYVKGGSTPDWPIIRKISSLLATLPARLFTDVKDPLAGFIGVKKERMANLNKDVLGFKIGLELLATAEPAMRVKEVPIVFRDRCYGDSKMTGSVILDYVKQLLLLAGVNLLPCKLSHLITLFTILFFSDTVLNNLLISKGISYVSASTVGFLSTAGIALISWLIMSKKSKDISCGVELSKVHAMFFVLNLALILFLRVGFTGIIGGSNGVSQFAIFSQSAISCFLLYYSTIVFSFSAGKKRVGRLLSSRIYGIGLLVYLLCSQLIAIFSASATGSEIHFLQNLFGIPVGTTQEIIFLRLGCWVCWLASAVFVFNFTKDICNRPAAFTSVFLFALLPFSFSSGIYATKETVLLLLWCALLSFGFRGFVYNRPVSLFIFTVTAWIGIWCHQGVGFVLAGIAGYQILAMFRGNIDDVKSALYSWGAVVFLGIVVFFSLSQEMSGMLPATNWFEEVSGVSITNAVVVSLLFLTPTVVVAEGYILLRNFFYKIRTEQTKRIKKPQADLFLGTVFFIPLTVALLAGFMIQQLRYEIVLCWVALLPIIADQINVRLHKDINKYPVMNYLWIGTIPVLIFLYFLRLYCFTTL